MAPGVGKKSGKNQKTQSKPRKDRTKKKHLRKLTFASYMKKLLAVLEENRTIQDRLKGISSKAISVMDSLVYDLLDRLATCAAQVAKYQNKVTIGYEDIRTATRILLAFDLGRHATAEGERALKRYMSSTTRRQKIH